MAYLNICIIIYIALTLFRYYIFILLMSKLYSSKSSMSSKTQYKQKERVPIKLVGNTKYHPLVENDTIYQQNLFRIVNSQFKFSIKTILMDLNFLLRLSQDKFFQQLRTSDELKLCLQSCIVCLPKKQYYRLSVHQSEVAQQEQIDISYYEALLKVVLTIYHRIAYTTKTQFKQLIYDQWLLDIPKIIDFCLIYVCKKQDGTYSNLQIVRNIVNKAIQSNYLDYKRDISSFISFVYQNKIETVDQHLDIIVDLQNLSKARTHFANPLCSFLISANKTLFSVKDLFIVIQYFYLCFPKQMVQSLATDYQIQERLIKIFIKFMTNTKDWKQSKFKHNFQINFTSIKQKIVNCLRKTIQINLKVLKDNTNRQQDIYIRALTTYNCFAMYFSCKELYSHYFDKLIQIFINQIYPQRLFFIQAFPNIKNITFNQKQKLAILKSIQLQLKIRQNIESSILQSFSTESDLNLSEYYEKGSQKQEYLKFVLQRKQIIDIKQKYVNYWFDEIDDTPYNLSHQLPSNWSQTIQIQTEQSQIRRYKNRTKYYQKYHKSQNNFESNKDISQFNKCRDALGHRHGDVQGHNYEDEQDYRQKTMTKIKDSLSFGKKSENQYTISNISSIKENLSQLYYLDQTGKSVLNLLSQKSQSLSFAIQERTFKKQNKIHFDTQNNNLKPFQQINNYETNSNLSFQQYEQEEEQNLSFQFDEPQQNLY